MMRLGLTLCVLAFALPAAARDSLGIYGGWGAFADDGGTCYAIARASPSQRSREVTPYATVSTWPRRSVRGQVHVRLSRSIGKNSPVVLAISDRRFALTGGGNNAWSEDAQMDAAIVAAMRSASRMTVSARDRRGRRFSDSYTLDGAATAMDAAAVACARRR